MPDDQSARDEHRARPSPRSLRGLDGINFLMADVRGGQIVPSAGDSAGFLTLAAIAVATLRFCWLLMPETRARDAAA